MPYCARPIADVNAPDGPIVASGPCADGMMTDEFHPSPPQAAWRRQLSEKTPNPSTVRFPNKKLHLTYVLNPYQGLYDDLLAA